jgi:hypothetical protein
MNEMRKNVLIAIIILLFASCNKDEVPESVRIERTIVVYMAADSDLWDVALVDLEEMKQGYRETGVNLIVLMDVADETPCLLKITGDGEQTIKTYSEFNSADPTTMNKLLGEIIEMYPSESYSLIQWSHGTSWLPAGVQLKSFVIDGNRQMNIPDLAETLPVHFDFILFDVGTAFGCLRRTIYI